MITEEVLISYSLVFSVSFVCDNLLFSTERANNGFHIFSFIEKKSTLKGRVSIWVYFSDSFDIFDFSFPGSEGGVIFSDPDFACVSFNLEHYSSEKALVEMSSP